MKNYNKQCCHLYYISKNNKCFECRCLFCDFKKKYKNKQELINDKYLDCTNTIINDNSHIVKHDYFDAYNYFQSIILKDVKLTNQELINKWYIYLYQTDSRYLLLAKKKKGNILTNKIYDYKMELIKQKIRDLEEENCTIKKL